MCEIAMPEFEYLILGINQNKLHAYQLNPALDYENYLPINKQVQFKTVRNLLAFPYEKPKYLIFTASTQELFSLNVMEIKYKY
jgi:hypothetical protein